MTGVWQFEAIGTQWQVDTSADLPPMVRRQVAQLIDDFDRTWSRFRFDSAASSLRRGGSADLGLHAPALFDLYDRLDAATGGAVNPCIGASLEQLGYDPVYSLTARGEPLPATGWSSCLRSGAVLTVPGPVVLDIGAVGKGYLADRVADRVVALTDGDCMVDASGDIVHRGAEPLRVALEHPLDSTLAVGVLELAPTQAVCGSARNRRAWGAGLHHVVDPRTGRPTEGVLAAWAVASDAAVADGCATALFFTEPDVLVAAGFDIDWVVLRDDGTMTRSDAFVGELFV